MRIFENIISKLIILLPDFEGKPTFNKVQILDKPVSDKNILSKEEKITKKSFKKPSKIQAGRDTNKTSKKKNKLKSTIQK